MAPRRLSDADKRDVIEIYRQPGETTSTIAKRYGVSTSTISRILKTQLPEDEHRALIAQKRAGSSEKPAIPAPKQPEEKSKPDKPVRRVRTRQAPKGKIDPPAQSQTDSQLTLLDSNEETSESDDGLAADSLSADNDGMSAVATELLNDPSARHMNDDDNGDLDDLDGDLDDLDEDELDSELDDEFDDDEFEESGETGLFGTAVEIMPLSDAVFPRTCYLVVDRLSELITHPLKEFAELGKIPAQQESAQTLPIFDNHRVARRFSRRNQRVIKVPDGQLITKTTNYLQAKGITHLLIDGNIYSLLG